AADGTKTRILETTQAYIGALEWDDGGRLLVGTGGERGQLYRLELPATRSSVAAAPFAVLPQKHIRAVSAHGTEVYVGTGDEGVLYRVDGSGNPTALFQTGDPDAKSPTENEVLAVAAAPEGVYFGTSNNGTLYRWSATDGIEALYPSPQQSLFALRRTADGKLYAGTGDKGVVYQIQPGQNANDTRVARILEPAPTQALSMALAPSGELLVGTGNNGNAYRIALGHKEGGTYTSPVFDAKNIVQWGAVRVVGQNAVLQTRSGNTLDPDTSWSAWRTVADNASGEQHVLSPAARYLQYRVNLPSDNATAQLARVEVLYRTRNSAPTVTIASPRGGEFWNDKQKLTWSAKDTDNDALRYRLWLSSDDGVTWQVVPLEDATSDNFELDTSKYKDGLYRVKIEATDAPRNPDDPQRDTFVSLPFTIDNTAPKFELQTVLSSADGPRLQATVVDALSPIAGAVWRVAKPEAKPATPETTTVTVTTLSTKTTAPTAAITAARVKSTDAKAPAQATEASKPDAKTGDKDDTWQAASAADGIFDSRRESILALVGAVADAQGTTATPQSTSTPRRIEVRAQDAAGNTSTITLPTK
ncbi:MAG: hypothetical protein JWN98_2406, partial [Abditibacteriota bacterium]|nr:hypothetical protein [Abditibacteriota bacterium]